MSAADRAEYIAGMRQLADALEAHPEVPLPYDGAQSGITIQFLYGDDPRAAMGAAASALPCSWTKNTYSDYFELTGRIAGLEMRLVAFRDAVCTKVVTGTEDVEVEKVITPAVTEKVTETRETFTWECGSLLAPAPEVSR